MASNHSLTTNQFCDTAYYVACVCLSLLASELGIKKYLPCEGAGRYITMRPIFRRILGPQKGSTLLKCQYLYITDDQL